MITICLTIIVCVIVICYAIYKINITNKTEYDDCYSDIELINTIIDDNITDLNKKYDESKYWDYGKSHETLLTIKTICKKHLNDTEA